jgi:hypothetical protein
VIFFILKENCEVCRQAREEVLEGSCRDRKWPLLLAVNKNFSVTSNRIAFLLPGTPLHAGNWTLIIEIGEILWDLLYSWNLIQTHKKTEWSNSSLTFILFSILYIYSWATLFGVKFSLLSVLSINLSEYNKSRKHCFESMKRA